MIYFIGAGPGAADLITVKGKELLEKADLIIYAGSLVNPELLNYAKPECIIMDSAKMTLEEVIAAMVPAAQAGKLVVRLHTGDPSVYGAHREQIDLLRSYNLDFEIVPGVSSFCAAAACLDAEYTLPNVSQSVIITRMEGRTPVPNKQKIAYLNIYRHAEAGIDNGSFTDGIESAQGHIGMNDTLKNRPFCFQHRNYFFFDLWTGDPQRQNIICLRKIIFDGTNDLIVTIDAIQCLQVVI